MAIRKAKTYQQLFRERYNVKPVDNRPSAAKRGYGRKWQETSKKYLEVHPRCVRCPARSTVADHIKPHRGDMILFWDRTNWQPMCKRCHDSKTAREDGGFGREKRHGT